MSKTKLFLQLIIVIIAIFSLSAAIWIMMKVLTVIYPDKYLFVTSVYVMSMLLIALIIGFFIKYLSKSSWHGITWTSVALTCLCAIYIALEFKPMYNIYLPDNFRGEVYLFVTGEDKDQFNIDNLGIANVSLGIGYISRSTYDKGFIPVIMQQGKEIKGRSYSRGTMRGVGFIVRYYHVSVGAKHPGDQTINVGVLYGENHVDTTRILKIKN